jgi:alpha-N-arabinofuranosidase
MKNPSVAVSVLGSALLLSSLSSCTDERHPASSRPALGAGPMGSGVSSMAGSAAGDACGKGVASDSCAGGALAVGSPSGTEGPTGPVRLDNPGGAAPAGAGAPPAPIACDESIIGGASPNQLTVDVTAAAQAVPKEIFGVLMETLGRDVNGGLYVGPNSSIPNTKGLRNDIIQGFMDAGVGAVQWPGGCAANTYDWAPNTNPANTMGTDLFMEFTTTIGAEPYLTGRPSAEYADSNRQWVEYINDNPQHPEWNLRYFKVGNEVWGCGGNLGHDAQALATYETWYNANWNALNAPVNGKNLFLVGATAGIWTVNPSTDNWLTLMVKPTSLADRIDGIEIHDYLYFPEANATPIPNVGFSDAQYYDVVNRANEGQIAPRIRNIRTILDRDDPAGRTKIVEDEWGDWLIGFNEAQDTWTQQGTVMDAISAAEHLHVFMANADRIQLAALAQPVNVIHSLFLTRAGDGALVRTPTFHLFKMFAPHHTAHARWAPNTLSSENIQGNNQSFHVLSSGATVDDTGGVNISLVNVDLVNPRSIDITLNSATTSYVLSSAQVITGAAKDSYNDFGQPEAVSSQPLAALNYTACGRSLSVTLPSKSVVMLRLDPQH